MVKGRNEPCQIVQVAEVIAHVKGVSLEEVAEACFQNSLRLYSLWDQDDEYVNPGDVGSGVEPPTVLYG